MLHGQVVGALACQKDSYLRSIEAEVVSCVKSTTHKAGGGQPSDHGTILPLDIPTSEHIKITVVERQGLRCVYHSPQPLAPGTRVRQEVDFARRWDHMQQHTGQHLLSAIMDTYDNLETLGWGMGAGSSSNYVDLPRKPSPEELQAIQDKCNEVVRNSLAVTVETPIHVGMDTLPSDYDKEKGVVRVIKIEDIDSNPCCGTHLRQTSHIALILLQSSQPVHSKNCRLFFVAGDRAVNLAGSSINAVRSIGKLVSAGSDPSDVLAHVDKLSKSVADLKKREAKLLQDIAVYEADRVKDALQTGRNAFVYRNVQGLEFINMVSSSFRDAKMGSSVVVLASGEEKKPGQIVVLGEKEVVDGFVKKIMEIGVNVKGGGKGPRWQGKVLEWKKGEIQALEKLVKS